MTATIASPAIREKTTGWHLVAYIVFGAVALSPLLWASVPPLIDYPDHLAQMAILATRDPSSPVLANYTANWRLLPNLAMELVVPALTNFLPLELSGRIFIGLILAMPIAGTALMHRSLHGRVGLWPLASVIFLYNDVFASGFMNFLFGLGTAILAFGLWISSETWPRMARLGAFAAISAAILILHLFAFGIFGLLVGSYEVGLALIERPIRIRNFLRRSTGAVVFIPALILWWASLHNLGFAYTVQGGLHRKIEVWKDAWSLNEWWTPLDASVYLVIFAFLTYVLFTRRLVVARAMWLPLIATFVAALLMPEWLSGSWGADLRLPVALPFILIGASRLDLKQPRWPLAGLASIGCALFCVRVAALSLSWHAINQQYTEFRNVIRALPAGARLMTVQSGWPNEAFKIDGVYEVLQYRQRTAFRHMDTLAVIDRGAFTTDLFTLDASVDVTPRNRGLDRTHWAPLTPEELIEREKNVSPDEIPARMADGLPPCCYNWPAVYDFVLWIDFGHAPADVPRILSLWAHGSFFHIYRVDRPL
jgi:hypothetical protein